MSQDYVSIVFNDIQIEWLSRGIASYMHFMIIKEMLCTTTFQDSAFCVGDIPNSSMGKIRGHCYDRCILLRVIVAADRSMFYARTAFIKLRVCKCLPTLSLVKLQLQNGNES